MQTKKKTLFYVYVNLSSIFAVELHMDHICRQMQWAWESFVNRMFYIRSWIPLHSGLYIHLHWWAPRSQGLKEDDGRQAAASGAAKVSVQGINYTYTLKYIFDGISFYMELTWYNNGLIYRPHTWNIGTEQPLGSYKPYT